MKFVPSEIVNLLKYVSNSEIDNLNKLKSAIKEQFQLDNDRSFLSLVDKISSDTKHALGDYTEAHSSGLIKAVDLLSLLKGEIESAEITYFHIDQGKISETQKTIAANEVFNASAAKTLLYKLLDTPEYQQQLYAREQFKYTNMMWQQHEDSTKSHINESSVPLCHISMPY